MIQFTYRSGTRVQMNLYSLHRNDKHWHKPDDFNPDRFLNSDGKVIWDDWFQPFGYGKLSRFYIIKLFLKFPNFMSFLMKTSKSKQKLL